MSGVATRMGCGNARRRTDMWIGVAVSCGTRDAYLRDDFGGGMTEQDDMVVEESVRDLRQLWRECIEGLRHGDAPEFWQQRLARIEKLSRREPAPPT